VLSDGKDFVILAFCAVLTFDTVPVCDGREDRQTDGQLELSCIASYADAL